MFRLVSRMLSTIPNFLSWVSMRQSWRLYRKEGRFTMSGILVSLDRASCECGVLFSSSKLYSRTVIRKKFCLKYLQKARIN